MENTGFYSSTLTPEKMRVIRKQRNYYDTNETGGLEREMPNVTINDIARCRYLKQLCHVYWNHPDEVDEKTRKTVQRVRWRENYRPSVTARNHEQKSSTIGVILPQVDTICFWRNARGMIHVTIKMN